MNMNMAITVDGDEVEMQMRLRIETLRAIVYSPVVFIHQKRSFIAHSYESAWLVGNALFA
jgi:hypothetical protein